MDSPNPAIGVGAIVIRDESLLMVRRAKDPGRGLWSVPGGRLERGEYIGDAVAREVKEETGLEVQVGGLVGFFEVVGDEHHYVILDFAATAPPGAEPVAGDDVDRVEWVRIDEVARRDCTPRFVEMLTAWGVLPS